MESVINDIDFPPFNINTSSQSSHIHYQEQIVLLYYNCTRKNNDEELLLVENILDNLLCSLKQDSQRSDSQRSDSQRSDSQRSDSQRSPCEFIGYLKILYKMIGHTRDIFQGKGERDLAYMMIHTLHKYYPALSVFCLYKFVLPLSDSQNSYGSWRDMKYFCEYIKKRSEQLLRLPTGTTEFNRSPSTSTFGDTARSNHVLIDICVELMNKTLERDVHIWNYVVHSSDSDIVDARKHISMVAKWIPREGKQFDWLNERLVINWYQTRFPSILTTYKDNVGYYAALDKCRMNYRRMVSFLNIGLDTTEIKICSQKWSAIIPKCMPQVCLMKYKQNLCYYTNIFHVTKHSQAVSRMNCSQNIIKHFDEKYALDLGVYDFDRKLSDYIPFSMSPSYFVKEAYKIIDLLINVSPYNYGCSYNFYVQIDVLNKQWNQMSQIVGKHSLQNCVPMIDMSFMADKNQSDSFYNAIGIACLIAERSSFGKRILLVDHLPQWINLEESQGFFSMVRQIHKMSTSTCYTSPNLFGAIELLIKSIEETKMSYRKIRELSFVFLQTTHSDYGSSDSLHDKIIALFYDKGLESSRKKPFPCPRFVYWNFAQTTCANLPCPIRLKNCIVLSGYSSSQLRYLNTKHHTAYDKICDILNHPRFNILDEYIDKIRISFG